MSEVEERGLAYTVEHVDKKWLDGKLRQTTWSQITTSNDDEIPHVLMVFEDAANVSGSYVELYPDEGGYTKVEAGFTLPRDQFDQWRFDMTRAECLMQNARAANNVEAMKEAYHDMCAIMSAATCRKNEDESYGDARDSARELLWDMLNGRREQA